MNIEELMREYSDCASRASEVDYANPISVRQYNAASDRMREIVGLVVALDASNLQMFSSLLDDDTSAHWLAPQLAEKPSVSPSIVAKCIGIVKKARNAAFAAGDHAEVMMYDDWLMRWAPNCQP